MTNLLFASYGTVGDIEILFTVLALVGVVFSLINTIEAIRDWGAVRRAGIGNGRRMLAWTSALAEGIRLIIQSIFATLGILAMFIPEPPPQLHQPLLLVVFGAVFRWGLILSSALLMVKSVMGHITRQHLRHERLERERAVGVDILQEIANADDPLTRPVPGDD